MINIKDLKTHCHYDDLENMMPYQLELAWLGCIFEEPLRCRGIGLLGLDRSMFNFPELFDLGLLLLRSPHQNASEMPETLIVALGEKQLMSQIMCALNAMWLIPAFFKQYAQKIEQRAQSVEPDWI
jgi:hypothetical protein